VIRSSDDGTSSLNVKVARVEGVHLVVEVRGETRIGSAPVKFGTIACRGGTGTGSRSSAGMEAPRSIVGLSS